MELETINRLYLELSQVATAVTKREAELIRVLELARKELAGLPHSLGYSFTHLPEIDAVLAKAKGG